MELIQDFLQNVSHGASESTIVIISAFISGFVAWIISRKSSLVTAVTTERTKWINSLRENISSLLGVCSSIHISKINGTQPEPALFEKADTLIALIQMQLNPRNEIDKNIIKILNELISSAQQTQGGYRGVEAQLVQHAQYLLKEEWEKVKTEAMGAFISIICFRWLKKFIRTQRYRKFAGNKVIFSFSLRGKCI